MFDLTGLVQLASFGASGVCILAIALTGYLILKLPNDTREWRVGLIKRYQTICVIIALISAISGVFNAYFNKNKIQEVTNAYNTEMKRINSSLDNLNLSSTTSHLNINPNTIKMKPLKSVIERKK